MPATARGVERCVRSRRLLEPKLATHATEVERRAVLARQVVVDVARCGRADPEDGGDGIEDIGPPSAGHQEGMLDGIGAACLPAFVTERAHDAAGGDAGAPVSARGPCPACDWGRRSHDRLSSVRCRRSASLARDHARLTARAPARRAVRARADLADDPVRSRGSPGGCSRGCGRIRADRGGWAPPRPWMPTRPSPPPNSCSTPTVRGERAGCTEPRKSAGFQRQTPTMETRPRGVGVAGRTRRPRGSGGRRSTVAVGGDRARAARHGDAPARRSQQDAVGASPSAAAWFGRRGEPHPQPAASLAVARRAQDEQSRRGARPDRAVAPGGGVSARSARAACGRSVRRARPRWPRAGPRRWRWLARCRTWARPALAAARATAWPHRPSRRGVEDRSDRYVESARSAKCLRPHRLAGGVQWATPVAATGSSSQSKYALLSSGIRAVPRHRSPRRGARGAAG